jgi:S1-C subfamily serine protease
MRRFSKARTMVERRSFVVAGASLATGLAQAAGLVDLIASMKPSVCAVGTFNALDSPRFGFRGTGFFVGNGSLVATCWHVLPEVAAETRPGVTSLAVLVSEAEGAPEVREADLVTSQRAHDLAVLRIKGRPGTPVNLAAASSPREGMEVALIGFPIGGVLGFKPVTHRGIVASIVASALPTAAARQLNEGSVARLREGSFELLQLDATAYPGNSGGPLFDVQTHQVIGVVNMVLVKNNRESALSQPTGITYAVPVRYLRDLLARS